MEQRAQPFYRVILILGNLRHALDEFGRGRRQATAAARSDCQSGSIRCQWKRQPNGLLLESKRRLSPSPRKALPQPGGSAPTAASLLFS